MKKIERLSELASLRADPTPMAAAGVMARVRGLAIENDVWDAPIRLFIGGAAAAAAAAVVVTLFAATAWADINNPFTYMDSLMDVMDVFYEI